MSRPAAPMTAEDEAFVNALAMVCVSLLILGQATAGFTDSDIWGHMSIGLDMLRERRFLWVDPYSFTHDQPWINHEWLWDLLVAGIYRAAGLPGVLVLRAGLVAVVLWAVERATRVAPSLIRLATLALVAVACAGQWRSTRPQIATLALYAVLLTKMYVGAGLQTRPHNTSLTTNDQRLTTNAQRLTTNDQRLTTNAQRPTTNDQRPFPWWLPLMFVLWANVHGGWVFGLGAVAAYVATHRSRRTVLVGTLCAVATLINPYGFRLWLAIADAMQRGWSDLSEWQPVWRLAAGADALLLWVVLASCVLWLLTRTTRDAWSWGWTVVALAAAANSRRLTAMAAVTGALLLVPRWAALQPIAQPRWTTGRRRAAAVAVAVSGAIGLSFVQPSWRCFPPMREWSAPEPDSVAFLRSVEVRRVVPHFDFGEYAIFHLRDRLQVAIDNRRETVYSDAAVQENQRFTDGLDPEYPDRIGADAVWWPRAQTRVIEGLEQRGWIRRFDGPRTVILMKTPGPLVHGRDAVGTPCFPAP